MFTAFPPAAGDSLAQINTPIQAMTDNKVGRDARFSQHLHLHLSVDQGNPASDNKSHLSIFQAPKSYTRKLSSDSVNSIIKIIKDKYSHFSMINRFLNERFLLADYYQPLFLIKGENLPRESSAFSLYQPYSHEEKEILDQNLFKEVIDNGKNRELLLVEGNAGVGKSFWCQRLSQKWAKGEILNFFSLVLYIPLSSLHERIEQLLKGKKHDLINETQAWCVAFGYDETESDYQGKFRDLKLLQWNLEENEESKKPVLYILDGMDEIFCEKENDYVTKIFNKLASKPYVILTSRPIQPANIGFYPPVKLQILGFRQPQAHAFVEKYYSFSTRLTEQRKNCLIRDVNSLIDDKFNLSNISNPLILELLCWLQLSKSESSNDSIIFPQGVDIYQGIANQLQLEWLKNSKSLQAIKGTPIDNISLNDEFSFTEIRKLATPLISLLEDSAYEAWKNFRVYLKGADLCRRFQEVQGIFTNHSPQVNQDDLFTHIGLLQPCGGNNSNSNFDKSWIFIHPSFYEYFVACCLYKRITQKLTISLALESLQFTSEDLDRLLNLESRVLPFLYGLLINKNSYLEFLKELALELIKSKGKLTPLNIISFIYCLLEVPPNKLNEYDISLLLPSDDEIILNQIWFTVCKLGIYHLARWITSQKPKIVNQSSDNQHSSLHFACEGRNEILVNHIISLAPHLINTINNFGRTPLHIAVSYHSLEVIKVLVDGGAHLEVATSMGETPLFLALLEEQLEIAQFLKQKGASFDNVNILGESIYLLIKQRHWHSQFDLSNEKLEELLGKINDNLPDETKLRLTICISADIEKAEQLLTHENINMTYGTNNENLLISTVFRGHEKMVELLIRKGIQVSHCLADGKTALHFAARKGYEKIAKLLLAAEPDLIDRQDKLGNDALSLATRFNQQNIITLIEKINTERRMSQPYNTKYAHIN